MPAQLRRAHNRPRLAMPASGPRETACNYALHQIKRLTPLNGHFSRRIQDYMKSRVENSKNSAVVGFGGRGVACGIAKLLVNQSLRGSVLKDYRQLANFSNGNVD